MTDNTPPAPTEKQEETLKAVAKEFEDTGKKKAGYKYRYVTSGGETRVVATKIPKAKA